MGVQVLALNMLPREAWLTTLARKHRSQPLPALPRKKAMVDCTKTGIGARAALIRPGRQRLDEDDLRIPRTRSWECQLGTLDATAALITIITGIAGLVTYTPRLASGWYCDHTHHYWRMMAAGLLINFIAVPMLAVVLFAYIDRQSGKRPQVSWRRPGRIEWSSKSRMVRKING
ncbi:MAG: hypothetical protein JET69_00540 [Methanomassiliicoccales archaeon]|nr:hypothetical protein [Methanomassiliicoccales archaeon]